ncbi:MAG: DinB family protein [Phycisphaeraceae bacterium]|nr:DinB family protein [Phycisphaeraceae bacterium]
MSPHDPYDTVGAILDVHKMVCGFILKAVDDVPESRMIEQPGTFVNHPAWTLSHLNAYAGVLLSLLDDPSAPMADAEMQRFGYGTTPVPDRAAYATKPDLLHRFKERNERLAAVVAEKHSDYFPRPAPKKFQPFSPTLGHIAITLLVTHPADHLGQLRHWRRVAGFVDKT